MGKITGKISEVINNHFDLKNIDFKQTDLFKRTDLETWYIASNAGVYDRTYGEIDQLALYIEQMYQQGGKCDVCEKLWKKIETKIKNYIMFHYEPDCKCYPRCYFCNRWMILEVKRQQGGCVYCGRDGIRCWKIVPVTKKDESGNVTKTNKWKKCKGILKLQPVENGCTIYKCTECDFILRKEIII